MKMIEAEAKETKLFLMCFWAINPPFNVPSMKIPDLPDGVISTTNTLCPHSFFPYHFPYHWILLNTYLIIKYTLLLVHGLSAEQPFIINSTNLRIQMIFKKIVQEMSCFSCSTWFMVFSVPLGVFIKLNLLHESLWKTYKTVSQINCFICL